MNRHLAPLRPLFLPAVRSPAVRTAGRLLAALLLVLTAAPAVPIAIVISTGGGGWTVNVPPANLPTVPGADMTVSTYTSAANQTVLRINRNPGGWMPGGTGWIVYVRKQDTTWHANLQLWIRRTNNPGGLVGPLNVYQQVTATDAEFFRCNSQSQVTNIRCQLQIRNVSAATVWRSNATSVIYTVTEF